jgi:heavy metal translocating P-type ATPase
MLFALPVLVLLGWPLLENAWGALRRGVFSTDLLLAAGVAAAYAYSMVAVIRGDGPVYFEVGCVVLVMVTLGRWLEATGKLQANDALDKLARLMPDTVRRVRANAEEEVALGEIVEGDLLRVLPGERFAADGQLARGIAFVDEQVLTGESRPALKHARDTVLGGTLNLDGDVVVEVTAAGAQGTLARLIELVRQARAAKGPYERLADRVSAFFVPAVTAVAIVTFVVHSSVGGLERGILQGLAVVLIACPCALGLATPLAVWTALGRAAREQVLFRSAESLERLAGIKAIAFDKTGTLTTGNPSVAALKVRDESERDIVLGRAAALAGASSHVLSRAIQRFAAGDGCEPEAAVVEVRALAGRGVVGQVGIDGRDTPTYLGSRRLMAEQGMRLDHSLERSARDVVHQGQSCAWIGWRGRARGLFVFDEQLRPSAREAIARCRALGLRLRVLTGDHAARARALATQLAIGVDADLLPEDKVDAIHRLRATSGPVAMVGDGINDAPALSVSDLGVALGCGTDLTRESAAVCLLGDDLIKLPWAFALARQTVSTIRGNLAWAFGYNSVGILLAACGWLSPSLAALLMVGSSVVVIVNSLRLRNVPGPGTPTDLEHADGPQIATTPRRRRDEAGALEAAAS